MERGNQSPRNLEPKVPVDESHSNATDSKGFKVLDPLGEIENRAKELLRESGESSVKCWRDFVEEAQDDLLCVAINLHHDIHHNNHLVESIAPQLAESRLSKENALLSAIAASTEKLLNQHEAYCLARMLDQSTFFAKESKAEISPSRSEIAYILSQVVEEYPSHVFKDESKGPPINRPLSERLAYWERQVAEWLNEDLPLNFSDRNTIQRFHLRMIHSGIITNIKQRFLSREG